MLFTLFPVSSYFLRHTKSRILIIRSLLSCFSEHYFWKIFFRVPDCWALNPSDCHVERPFQPQPVWHLPGPGDDLQSSRKLVLGSLVLYHYSGTIQLLLLLVQKNVLFRHWSARERPGRKNNHVWGTVYFLSISISLELSEWLFILFQMLLLKINLFATEFSSNNIWLYWGMNINFSS